MMKQQAISIKKIFFIFLTALFLAVFNLKSMMSVYASENVSMPKSDLYLDDTNTPTPSSTPTSTATGTLISSRYIIMDYMAVSYPNGSSGITVTQNNSCEPTSQGGLHCTFTGSGSTTKSLRSVKPFVRFHWSDNANARTVYRYQIATISHTNTFHYGNVVPLDFFGIGLADGYHEWSGIGNYANCSPYYCDMGPTFYLLGGYGTYTWTVDTYIAPVAIDIYAPTVTPTLTPTVTFTPSNTPTVSITPTSSTGPRSFGNGACWNSGPSWPIYGVTYNFHSSLPTNFEASIDASAQTWNDVVPSNFNFNRWTSSSNLIRYEVPLDNPEYVGGTIASPSTGPYTSAVTRLNPDKTWDTNIPPASNKHSVQAVMTHEFGHWVFLFNIDRTAQPNCTHVTMDEVINPGDFGEITLANEDEEGVNWQYP